MTRTTARLFCALGVLLCCTSCGPLDEEEMEELGIVSQAVFSNKTVGSMGNMGDSISAAFNAKYNDYEDCRYDDTKDYNFATNTSSGGTYSIAERIIAYKGSSIPLKNVGKDGARMTDAPSQAATIKTWALSQATPRVITVFLGHNDICSNTENKTNSSCSRSTADKNNYCRTSYSAYEKSVRQMLDVLVTIPSARIGLVHPVRVTQLCAHRDRYVIDTWLLKIKCKDLWSTVAFFDEGGGVCRSLTKDCSDTRIADAYNTWAQYRTIVNNVRNHYNGVAAGATVPVNSTFGTGGVVKASSVQIQVTDAVGKGKFNYKNASGDVLLSKCECFHPTRYGQDYLADLVWNGLTCSTATPCCDDTANNTSILKGKCTYTKTDGSKIVGLW